MIIETPVGKYRWIENWVTIPDSPLGRSNGRTHGIAVLKTGEIVVFHQADPAVLIFSPEAELVRAWGNFPGAHGLTVSEESGWEILWLVDEVTKKVVKVSTNGDMLMSLPTPPHPAYDAGDYIPTWVAVAERRHGGNGDIWVADGYGSSMLHRFKETGEYLGALDGTEGAGRFNCPHGIALDTRGGVAEFYIADRGNRRFQVYSLEGVFRRSVGEEFLNSPDVCVSMGDLLVVPELVAGLTILDGADLPVARIGFNTDVASCEGWPNNRNWVVEGKFNSPHSAAADSHGNIYVVEWLTGGRVIKLERLD